MELPELLLAIRDGKNVTVDDSFLNEQDTTFIGVRLTSGLTPLHLAVLYERYDLLEDLLERGAKPDTKTTGQISNVASGTFSCATSERTTFKGKTNLPRPGTAFDKGMSALHMACGLGDPRSVDLLLTHKARPTLKDGAGATPLHHAANSGNLDIVTSVLETGKAKIDTATKLTKSVSFFDAGTTELLCALRSGRLDVVELLIAHGANIEVTTKAGCDAFLFAVMSGCEDVVHYVANSTADASTVGKYYTSPLIEAVKGGNPAIVEMLLDAGAPKKGKAMWWATRRNFRDVRNILIGHGIAEPEHKNIVAAAVANDTTYIESARSGRSPSMPNLPLVKPFT